MEFDIYFPLIEELLHGELNPERPENNDGHHFTIRLQEQSVSQTGQVGKYALRYPKPISPKCSWYLQLLKSETNGYCLDALNGLSTEKNEFVRNYLRKQMLDDHLTTCLMRVGEVIRSKNFRLEELENPAPDADRDRLSNIYIWHLLKVCLIKAYLEVQEILSDVVGWKQTEESLCLGALQELPPFKRFLISNPANDKQPPQRYSAIASTSVNDSAPDLQQENETVMDDALFYDTGKMCELYVCSESTLKRKVKSGEIPSPIKLYGKKNLYSKMEVDIHLSSLRNR